MNGSVSPPVRPFGQHIPFNSKYNQSSNFSRKKNESCRS